MEKCFFDAFLGQEDNQIEVYVSAVESPAKFWLQIVGPKAVELDYLLNDMTEYYSKPENQLMHILDEVNAGDLVAAIFPYDNKWSVRTWSKFIILYNYLS